MALEGKWRPSFLRRRAPARILCFAHETTWSGAPIQLFHLVTWWKSRGWETAVAVPQPTAAESGPITAELARAGVPAFPVLNPSAPPDFAELRRLCAKFEVVIANTLVMWAAVRAAHEEGVPVIWYIHESLVAQALVAQVPEIKPALQLADLLVMPTRRTAQLYAGWTDRPIEVVPYGIPEMREARGLTIPTTERMRFLLLGTYEPRKGQDVFLEAISQLPEGTRARGAFRAAGRKLEPGFYDALAARAAALPNVDLSGALEHDAALAATNTADVLVCASRDETMPIAILEAMSLGKAIVSTEVGGISEWLSDGQNALIVPPENSAALAQAMGRCLNEPGLVKTLGANARRTFAQNFSIDRLGKSFARLIQQVRRKP